MRAVDTNVLINAHRVELDLHEEALRRLVALAEEDAPWALPAVVAQGFLRIVTSTVFSPPTAIDEAFDFVGVLLDSPSVRVLTPGPRHFALLRDTAAEARIGGARMTDAVIVALCREHGVDTVLSADSDFRLFPSITWDPL